MSVPVLFDTADDAERAFYMAFEQADLEAMMQVWDHDDDVVCVHPLGPCLQGLRAVQESWRGIFQSGSAMRLDVKQRQITRSDTLSVHCVMEHITHGPQLQSHSVIIATNIYKRTPFGWRMIAHHASPGGEEPSDEGNGIVRSGRLH